MQEEGKASLEGNTSDQGQTEDIDRMRHLAGLTEHMTLRHKKEGFLG